MWMLLAAVMVNERITNIDEEEECNRALFAMLKDTALPFTTRFNVLRILAGLLDRVNLLERLYAEDSTDEEEYPTEGEEETHQEREERWADDEAQFNAEQEEQINLINEEQEEERELEELRADIRRSHGSADLHSANE